jgi:hypothetical protein
MKERLALIALVCIGAFFIVLAWVAAIHAVGDPDVFWVATAGRWMLEHHAVPRQNLWGILDAARPWVFHEWLFGVPYAVLMEGLGVSGLPLVALVSFTVGMTLVLGLTVGRTPNGTGLFFGGLALACFTMRLLTPRATHVAMLLPLGILALLERPRLGPRHIVGLVVLETLWANAHGSFPLGLALIGLTALEVDGAERVRRFLVLGLALAATVLNPYGLRLHHFVFNYLTGHEEVFAVIHAHVDEFASIIGNTRWLETRGAVGLFVMLALALVGLVRPGHRLRALFVLALGVMACRTVRFVDLAGLLGCALLTRVYAESGRTFPIAPEVVRRALTLVPLVSLVVGVGAWTSLRREGADDTLWVAEVLGGANAVTLARDIPDGARVFADFKDTGLVLWYGAARGVRILYDARNDPYPARTAEVAFGLLDGSVPVEALDLARVDVTLLPRSSPASVALAASGQWRVRRGAGTFELLERAAPLPEAR